MQCIYSSVSEASLQKTGVLLNSAADFREFSPKNFENGAVGDFQQLEKPAIGGSFCHQRRKFSKTRNAWLGREDSNLRMVESKSGYSTNDFNAYSEKDRKFVPRRISSLAADSE
jgi:hypothetical protein